MTAASSVFAAEEISNFMSHLFGLDVRTGESAWEAEESVAAVATYVDGSDFVRGRIACDLRCAAMLGAALTQIPMRSIEDCLENNELSSNLRANAYEVFNISVNLFSYQQSSRVVLKDVAFGARACLPENTESWKSEDFRLSIDRYCSGMLRMIHRA